MAMSPKSISLLFLLITHFFSTQIHARDSQFFSKVSSSTNNEKEATTTTSSASPTNQPEQDPTFIPQTQNDNYGLYGNQYQDETNTQIPTTTKLAGSLEESNAKTNSDNHYYYHPNTNNNAYEEQQRERDQQEQREEDRFVQTSLQDVENSEYPSKTNTNTESKFTNQNQYYYNTNTNNNNKERQGMSDTRYLENGRYFYDLANEKNMYYDSNSQFKSTGTSYTTTTTPQGYYNNNNNNEQFNPKGNYPEEEEEFHASENEQYVP